MSEHQTAEQINHPQVGESKFTTAPPAPGFPKPPAPPKSPEVWSARGLRGPAAEIISKIRADEKIPDEDKDWIIRKIEKSGFAGVVVDAHEHFHDGMTTMNASVVKLY